MDSTLATLHFDSILPADRRYDELAAALRRLGELYEAGGEEAKAAAAYTRLLALWRRADPELSPTLREIRSRLGSGGG